MKTQKPKSQPFPQHDYQLALQGALSWLGDRYLLAEPLNRRNDDRKPEEREDASLADRVGCRFSYPL